MSQQLSAFCKYCGKTVAVAQVVKEREDTVNKFGDQITIYWDYVEGVCGHTLEERSH